MIRLLLVGAGHAHLEILRRQILVPLPFALTLVSPEARHHYSGMVPGYLQGTYTEDEISFRVQDLAEQAGGRFVCARAESLDPGRQVVRLSAPGGATEMPYDLVSFAVGSTSAGAEAPEVTAHAQAIKPIGQAVELRRKVHRLAEDGGAATIAVVGGGAAGVEVALAVHAELATHGARPCVTLVESGDDILAGYPLSLRRRARAVLKRRGIAVRTGSCVTAVRPAAAVLDGGEEIPARITLWLTGAVAWPLFQGSGLAVDSRGFLLVDDALRSVNDPRVFAAGDCATLANHPRTPKAGVFAVREAPFLWQSLQAAALGTELPRYRPQSGFLSLLNTADGRALLRWKALTSHSRWAWRLKDRIDRRFMRRYQQLI